MPIFHPSGPMKGKLEPLSKRHVTEGETRGSTSGRLRPSCTEVSRGPSLALGVHTGGAGRMLAAEEWVSTRPEAAGPS